MTSIQINTVKTFNQAACKKNNVRKTMALPITQIVSFKGGIGAASFYGENEVKVKASNQQIRNESIQKLTLMKPGFWGDNTVAVYDSKIGEIKGYGDKRAKIYLFNESNVGIIDNALNADIANGSKVNVIKNVRFAHVLSDDGTTFSIYQDEGYKKNINFPKCGNIESISLDVQGTFERINNIKNNYTSIFSSDGTIENIETSKLEINGKKWRINDEKKHLKIKNIHVSDKPNLVDDEKYYDYAYRSLEDDCKNGEALIRCADIDNLSCKYLTVKNSNLGDVIADNCEKIENTQIKTLKTNNISAIENSTIEKIIVSDNKFTLNSDENSEIKNIEFIGDNGILTIKNKRQFIPKTNVINGSIKYELENISLDNLNVKKDLTAIKNINIKELTVEDENSLVTIIGRSKIENINFKNGGKVILKNNEHGIHPDINKIKVTNGEIIKDYPPKGLEKVAGMNELKQQLREDVIEPLTKSAEYSEYGLSALNGFLLYGPPGCGKTFITRMLAEETGRYFVELPASSVGSKYQHETVENIAKRFKEARDNAPSIIFVDEIEAMAPSRDGLADWDIETNERVTEFLQQINNCKDIDVLVVSASNEPQKIDKAIKRTGRTDKLIFLGPPDEKTRKELFKMTLSKINKKEQNIDFDKLAKASEFYTAEDIRMIVREASVNAMKAKQLISTERLLNALETVMPSLNKKVVEQYKNKGEM